MPKPPPPSPLQCDLFGDEAEPSLARAVAQTEQPAAKLGKAQREFKRSLERLEQLKQALSAWRHAESACQQRAAKELMPLETKLRALQRETVLWADTHLREPPAGERLPRKLREKLVLMLRLLADAVLDASPDDEVEAAHDRHSAQTRREARAEQADLAAAMMGAAFGDDALFEGEADSVEEVLDRAAERMDRREREEAEAAATAHPPRPDPRTRRAARPDRAEQARARDAKALEEASQSVRAVYRRLASSLHPDRAADNADRNRKTALMARVNEAYGRNDLLALLSMQLEIEQVDAGGLIGLPDERLRHYTRVLREQEQALEQELLMVQMPVLQAYGLAPGAKALPPALLTRKLEDDIDGFRQAIRHLSHDAGLLRDPRTRLQTLRALEIDDPDDELDPLETAWVEQRLAEGAAGFATSQRGRPAASSPRTATAKKAPGRGRGKRR